MRRNPRYIVQRFHPRFVPERMLAELSNLWHLSRTHTNDRYQRLLWTSEWFPKEHPELGLSPTAVYKDLTGMLEFGGRNNPRPNPQGAADEMFQSFHGYPSDRTIEVEEEFHEHEHLANIGKLVELEVKTVTGYKAVLAFEPKMPFLATNEEGSQLYIVGGNQSLDLKALHFTEDDVKDLMVIGQVFGLTYRTRKWWHDGERDEEDVDYHHKVGEESGDLPDLLYDPHSKKLSFAGGRYRIDMPSGQTSPGIED